MVGLSGRARAAAGSLVRRLSAGASRVATVGPDDRHARRFGRFGRGTSLAWPWGSIYNERYIHLGDDVLIAPRVTLSVGMVAGQEMVTDPVIRIGHRCLMASGTSIVAHFAVDVGDDVFMGMNVYITDQNHGYEALDEPIGRQMPSEAAVSIGAGSWLGAGVVVLPGSVIGRHVVVAANSVVRGEVPDNCVVAGVPARIVRRHDGTAWESVSRS